VQVQRKAGDMSRACGDKQQAVELTAGRVAAQLPPDRGGLAGDLDFDADPARDDHVDASGVADPDLTLDGDAGGGEDLLNQNM
jgi:hypothetical protein